MEATLEGKSRLVLLCKMVTKETPGIYRPKAISDILVGANMIYLTCNISFNYPKPDVKRQY